MKKAIIKMERDRYSVRLRYDKKTYTEKIFPKGSCKFEVISSTYSEETPEEVCLFFSQVRKMFMTFLDMGENDENRNCSL